MAKLLKTVLFSCLLASVFASSYAQSCNSYSFNNNKHYATCITLPVQNSYLHWNYNSANRSVDLAYRHTGVSTSQWVCWALNLAGKQMVGSQCLVAFTNTSGVVQAYTSSVNSYTPSMQPSNLSFSVPSLRAERVNGDMIIFATLELPSGGTSFTQVWQIGPVNGNTLGQHALGSANTNSIGTVDFSTGQASASAGSTGSSIHRRKNVHGVLNAVSWGVLMPMGAMVARYLKVFKVANPAWFYVHVACQVSAYGVGVAGWGTGVKLGRDTPGADTGYHGKMGLTIFILGTIQLFALLLRPKPDHKYRLYWNIYHHTIGYTVIILSIVNIFKGFDILDPEKKWKRTYIGILIALGAIAATLEAFTWFIVLNRKNVDKQQHTGNGRNGANGYGNSNGYSA